MNRLDILYSTADWATVAAFVEALQSRGIEVQPAASGVPTDNPVAVLITESMLSGTEVERAYAIAGRYGEVLPVSFLPGAAPVFADLSQSLISQLGVEECAARISTIVRFGGGTIVGWNNLVADAQRWQAEGTQALLPESEVDTALSLLQSGPALESTRRDLVADYVSASQQAISRRRRVGMSLIGATAFLLSIVLVFAVVQAISARVAQTRAQDAGNAATADRLAREAIQVIPGSPDLPTLLAIRALEAAPTAAAQAAVVQVAASTWPHESYQLGFRPLGITASRGSERVAVVDASQDSVVIYDSPGGNTLAEFAVDSGGKDAEVTTALSPDGHRIAIQPVTSIANLRIKAYDIEHGQDLHRSANAADTLLSWLDNDTLLIGRGSQVLAINVSDRTTTVLAEAADGEIVDSASVHPEHNRLVVATDNSTMIINLTDYKVERTTRATVTDPVLSTDGQTVLGMNYPFPVSFSVDDEPTDPQQYDIRARQMLSIDGDYSLITKSDGEVSVLGTGRAFQTVRAHLSGRVWAARLQDGRFATVGADGYLRVWSVPGADTFGVPTSIGFVGESVRMPSVLGIQVAARESARNQIRIPTDGYLAATAVPGYAHVIATDGLETTDRRFFDGLLSDISLSRDGSHIASVGIGRSRSFRFDESEEFWGNDGKQELPGSPIEMAIGHGAKGVSAVSDDGATILIADEYQLSRRRAGDNSDHRFEVARRPAALSPETDGQGTVLTVDGYLRYPDGTETALTLADEPDAEITAAEPHGDGGFTLVTETGKLFSCTAEVVTYLGDIGSGHAPFALRTSTNHPLITVIGAYGVTVFDTNENRVVFAEPAPGDARITDAVFAADGANMYAVNELGAVRSINIADQPSSEPVLRAPRELTPQESTLFNLEED